MDLQTIMTSPSRRHSHGQGMAGSRGVNLHDVIKLGTYTPLSQPRLDPNINPTQVCFPLESVHAVGKGSKGAFLTFLRSKDSACKDTFIQHSSE